jgi:hypothetical protein
MVGGRIAASGQRGNGFYSAHSRSSSGWTVATGVSQQNVEGIYGLGHGFAREPHNSHFGNVLVIVFGRRIARCRSRRWPDRRALESGENVETEFATGVAEVDEVNAPFANRPND